MEIDIPQAIQSEKPIQLSMYRMDKAAAERIKSIISRVLAELNKEYLIDSIYYLAHEFAFNADKSNLKRAHFQDMGLNIDDPDHYQNGIASFSQAFRDKRDEYGELAKHFGWKTSVILLVKNNTLVLAVKNNSVPTEEEYGRMKQNLSRAQKIKNIFDAYTDEDAVEGAGLGIISTILTLRGLGLSHRAYSVNINREKKETLVKVLIPLAVLSDQQSTDVSDLISKKLSKVPQFPDNVLRIQRLINENADFDDIAGVFKHDPGLTAELLKIVNSAQYMLPQKVANITQAVSLIGKRGLHGLLFSYGAQKTLDATGNEYDKHWEHAFQCAFYSARLTKHFGFKGISDEAYTAGMLHDLGKIMVIDLGSEVYGALNDYADKMNLGPEILETLMLGLAHTKIGAALAEQWEFPALIREAIANHHHPLIAEEEHRKLTAIVYLADILCHWDSREVDRPSFSSDVAQFLGISDRGRFAKTAIELKDRYDKKVRSKR